MAGCRLPAKLLDRRIQHGHRRPAGGQTRDKEPDEARQVRQFAADHRLLVRGQALLLLEDDLPVVAGQRQPVRVVHEDQPDPVHPAGDPDLQAPDGRCRRQLGLGTAVNFSLYGPVARGDKETVKAYMQFYKKAYRIIALVIACVGLALVPFLRFIIRDPVGIDSNADLIGY